MRWTTHRSTVPKDRCTSPVLLPPQEGVPRKTLVLDLDRTLIDCIPFKGTASHADPDFVYTDELGTQAKVWTRPFLDQFLAAVSRDFEVVLFTAAGARHADSVLHVLDPHQNIFSHRLYGCHTTQMPQWSWVKDLSRFGRSLSSTLLVDDSLLAGLMQPCSLVPVRPFHHNCPQRARDTALPELLRFLQDQVLSADDVRHAIALHWNKLTRRPRIRPLQSPPPVRDQASLSDSTPNTWQQCASACEGCGCFFKGDRDAFVQAVAAFRMSVVHERDDYRDDAVTQADDDRHLENQVKKSLSTSSLLQHGSLDQGLDAYQVGPGPPPMGHEGVSMHRSTRCLSAHTSSDVHRDAPLLVVEPLGRGQSVPVSASSTVPTLVCHRRHGTRRNTAHVRSVRRLDLSNTLHALTLRCVTSVFGKEDAVDAPLAPSPPSLDVKVERDEDVVVTRSSISSVDPPPRALLESGPMTGSTCASSFSKSSMDATDGDSECRGSLSDEELLSPVPTSQLPGLVARTAVSSLLPTAATASTAIQSVKPTTPRRGTRHMNVMAQYIECVGSRR